jgi:hypothetical protein
LTTYWLNDGCETKQRSAARLKLYASATAATLGNW